MDNGKKRDNARHNRRSDSHYPGRPHHPGKTGIWSFNASWPVLLIAIAVGTLIQNVKDLGGWIILVVGVIFLLTEIFGVQVYALGKYLLPVLIIVVGANILMKQRKR